ncbi:hypothetical protein B0H13DRAFT_2384402 [Mycena leptocephala]|nr:hypothetical protein B0H13DRAFT_2384402 [Mycena leptocephala]
MHVRCRHRGCPALLLHSPALALALDLNFGPEPDPAPAEDRVSPPADEMHEVRPRLHATHIKPRPVSSSLTPVRANSPLPVQICFFILWKEVGKRMGIQDILPTVEDLKQWSLNYEIQHMVPSEASSQLAQIAMTHIHRRTPNIPGLHRFVSGLFICLMDDRLRTARCYRHSPLGPTGL